MKTILIGAALLLLPAATFAASHMEKKEGEMAAPAAMTADPAMPAATPADPAMPAKLPRCTAKIQDSCDQSMTTEKNALSYYPAESRDAGNNKIAGMKPGDRKRAVDEPK